MPLSELLYIMLGTGLAAALKSGAGVGVGLFLLPVLSMRFEPFIALGMSVPLLLTMDIFAVTYHWNRWISPPLLVRMASCAIVGIFCGTVIIPYLSTRVLAFLIGITGTCYALSNLLPGKGILARLPLSFSHHANASIYVAMFFGGLFNTINAGSLFYAYALMHLHLENRLFIASLSLLSFTGNFVRAIGFYNNGLVSTDMLFMSIKFLPIIVVCSWLGGRYLPKLPQRAFRAMIYLLILAVSGKMLLSYFL